LRTKKTLETDLDRQSQQLVEAAKRADTSLSKTKATLPVEFEKKQIEQQKQLIEHKRSEEKLKELIEDRQIMNIKAPADGYVYYGRCTRGKWSGVDTVANQLRPGGKLTANNVFMTVVAPRPLRIRVEVPEKELHRLARGMKGKAIATGYPNLELPATVQHVAPFPITSGTFDGHMQVALGDNARPIVPGMTCKLTLVAYEKKEAMAVPAAAVFEDEASGERNIVFVKKDDDQHEKRKVSVGQKTEQQWEILEGLRAGEEILLKKPEA
jgi:RND family efflux transporter MFP subunit